MNKWMDIEHTARWCALILKRTEVLESLHSLWRLLTQSKKKQKKKKEAILLSKKKWREKFVLKWRNEIVEAILKEEHIKTKLLWSIITDIEEWKYFFPSTLHIQS